MCTCRPMDSGRVGIGTDIEEAKGHNVAGVSGREWQHRLQAGRSGSTCPLDGCSARAGGKNELSRICLGRHSCLCNGKISGHRAPWGGSLRGKDLWQGVAPAERVAVYEQALAQLASHDCVVAHSSIDKTRLSGVSSPATSPHNMAFQFLIEKINTFVRGQEDPLKRRAILIADETDEHHAFQISLVHDMQRSDGGIGASPTLTNIVDTVHFVDSRQNRGVQLADLVAYGCNRTTRARLKGTIPLGDQALLDMYQTHIEPQIRTWRGTWPGR